MDCKQARGQIAAYLDDELEATAAAGVALHLASCAACGARAEQMQAMHHVLRRHGIRYAAPPALRRSLRQALRAEVAMRPRWRMPSLAWATAGLAGATCAALLAVLALQPSQDDRLDQDLVASHFRALMSERLADVASADQHTVKPWFSGKLDYSPPVTDLAAQGYALVGGRLDYVNERQVAALAYRHRKHDIDLYVWPDAAGSILPREATRRGFHLRHWSAAGMHYAAISDMNVQELDEFARLLTP